MRRKISDIHVRPADVYAIVMHTVDEAFCLGPRRTLGLATPAPHK